ncbi:MAG: hypothetical protein M3277_04840 [Actinomycetota bacterium]|nr:hypothetical protein [Actinomycetota bacterium]
MYKRVGVVAVALLLGAVAWVAVRSPSDVAPRAFDAACSDNRLSTFNVTVTPSKQTYVVGDVARFKVAVTRAAKADEHDEGEEVGPAEGADVKLGISIGTMTVAAEGITDPTGLARLSVRLPTKMPGGHADVVAFAEKEAVPHDCVPHESGHFDAEDFVRIRR